MVDPIVGQLVADLPCRLFLHLTFFFIYLHNNYIKKILDTWTNNRRPKFHVSEQGTGKIGHHSDYIEIIPDYLLNIPDKYGIKIDIMIEAKMKELSIQKLYEKYPQCNCKVISSACETVCETECEHVSVTVNEPDSEHASETVGEPEYENVI